MNFEPHKVLMVYYVVVTIATTIMAVVNTVAAYYVYRFVKRAIPSIRNIEKYTRTVRTDVLLKRNQWAKEEVKRRQNASSNQ